MFFPNHPTQVTYLILINILVLSCSKSYNPDIERGADYKFRVGYPEVHFSAIGFLNQEQKPSINIAAEIVYGSLVYKEINGKYRSNFTIEIQILDRGNNNVAESLDYNLGIEKKNPSIVNSQEIFTFEKDIPVKPGDYRVNLILSDDFSAKTISRSAEAFVPDPEAKKTNLTNIQLLGKQVDKRNGKWIPITTYDIAGKKDSLKFVFQVLNNDSENRLDLDSRLVRFQSDTTPARPMNYPDYSPSSIQYKGIDYDDKRIINSNRRILSDTGSIFIEYKFSQQNRGNYRFEIENKNSGATNLYKARDFSVKSEHYPAVKSPHELARPLVYLMEQKEHDLLMKISNPDSLKEAVDRFWLKHIKDKAKAKEVIQMYYERVEEANKQFSNFKEGWKTDAGMMYILFGPPWYVEQHLETMTWSYAYDRNDQRRNFEFRQPKIKSKFFPFNHYLLDRKESYHDLQYKQINIWLSGQILSRNL